MSWQDTKSYDATDYPCYIEVKTINGAYTPAVVFICNESNSCIEVVMDLISTGYVNLVRPRVHEYIFE